MFKKITRMLVSCALAIALTVPTSANTVYIQQEKAIVDEIPETVVTLATEEPIEAVVIDDVIENEPEPIIATEPDIQMSTRDIELIALVTMAEAEGEPEEGKRLVIDTILNRVDSKHFPDTVEGVIYQPSQFTSMWNGRVDRCYVMDDICQLVREELVSRANNEVVFFTAGRYSAYGVPMFQVGNHYFSSYN